MLFPRFLRRRETPNAPTQVDAAPEQKTPAQLLATQYQERAAAARANPIEAQEQGDDIIADLALTARRIKEANVPGIVIEDKEFSWKNDEPSAIGHLESAPVLRIVATAEDGTLVEKRLGWNHYPKNLYGADTGINCGTWVGYSSREWEAYKGGLTAEDVPSVNTIYMPGLDDPEKGVRVSELIAHYEYAAERAKLLKGEG